MLTTTTEVLVADEAWIALASLHRRHPERESFSAAEIMESAKREKFIFGVLTWRKDTSATRRLRMSDSF